MTIYIPKNDTIKEHGYFSTNKIVELLRKYKDNPKIVQFIADMMEI
jgi:hypothetical protein